MRKSKLFILAITVTISLFVSQTFSQWQFVGFQTGLGTFPSISVYGPTNIILIGGPNGTGKVFRSTNGGSNFTDISGSGLVLELYCGWAVDGNTMFVGDGGASGGAGGNAKIYKTTNGGTSWTNILSTGGSAGFINSIVFSRTTPTFGVIQSDPPNGAGQPYYVQRTTDGGNTWSAVTVPGIPGAASSQNGLVVIDNQFFNFGLNAGASRLYGTANGGTSWSIWSLSGITGAFMSGNAWSTDKQRGCGCSSGSLPSISRTTNGGTSWAAVNVGAGVTGYCSIKWVYGTDKVYILGALGAGGVGRKSTNGGATWTSMTTGGITGITNMEYYKTNDSIYLYGVAGDGSVIRLVEPVANVGIDPNNTNVPSEYSIDQNYPNPFNPTTNIKYSIPKAGNVSIKIYNSLGVELLTVVNQHHNVGNYIEEVNMDGYASGVYFYTINSGDFTQTKKMMLVK